MKRRFPAEWENQFAVLIAWPFQGGDFGDHLTELETSYQCIAEAILQQQPLLILCKNAQHQHHIQTLLPGFDQFIITDYNDVWVRDTGPISLIDNNLPVLVNFQFNGWGKKYLYKADNAIHHSLFKSELLSGYKTQSFNWVLEGGSIESDGCGSLLTTRQCLLNPNRNPDLNQTQIEQKLKSDLGVDRVLWLDQTSLEGDDTDAHIDTLARFCTPEHIVYSSCDDIDDPHYAELNNMQTQLQSLRTRHGQPYQLTPLPLPSPIYDTHEQRLPANYANFLIINNAVLVPTYSDPKDLIALERLKQCFPKRKLIPIPCLPIIQQFGSLHCMSMQIASPK